MKFITKSNFQTVVLAAAAIVVAGCSGNNFSGSQPGVAVPAIASVSGNATSSSIVVTATNPANPNARATASLPAGVTLITGSGQTVSGDNVVVTVEAFDGTAESEALVQGGTTFVDQVVNSQIANALGINLDSSKAATLDLAGYVNVNVSAAGQAIKQFSPPISITIKTDLPVNAIAAIISIDEQSGARRFEGVSQVGQGGNVVVNTDHLSVFATIRSIIGLSSGAGGGSTQ